MNKIYHSIWNEALNAWVDVSEISRGQGKRAVNRCNRQKYTATLLASGLLLCSSAVLALPTGNELVSGQATINTPNAAQMQINQNSQNAIINWQGFSIAPNETVNIHQPNTQAALLNRVIGQDASQIQGRLNANGQVYLVNPNGVLFSKTGQVDVGGLVASTHHISDTDFQNSKQHFTQNGATNEVNNQGLIKASSGGVVALIGSHVNNAGTITTPKGTTVLAAGKTVDLDFKGDGLVAVKVSEAALNAEINNHGAILADAGRVVLTAKAAGQLIDTVINQDGIIRAHSMNERHGEIILDGNDNGNVNVGGTLSTQNSVLTGGNINITGKNITLQHDAHINASGHTGGGQITIGDIHTTQATHIAHTATLSAVAEQQGKAGNITVLANMNNGAVNIAGTLNASAPKHGDGGFIHTSAAQVTIANTASIRTLAKNGDNGTWLIDPHDFTIAATGGNITGTALTTTLMSNAVKIQTTHTITNCTGVTCSTVNGSGVGDIFVNEAVNWSANKLTLSAFHTINFNANLNGSGRAKLALEYGQGNKGGEYVFKDAVNITLPAGRNFSTQLGSAGTVNNYTVITSLGAAGSQTTKDLQGIQGDLTLNYALGANIDAYATRHWNAGAGFMPILGVTGGEDGFLGSLDGLGHTITGLTNSVGLFSWIGWSGNIANLGLLDTSIKGGYTAGGLAANNDGHINNVYVTGNISGTTSVGGLVGRNGIFGTGSINNSYATSHVTGVDSVGGLVGSNSGYITNSYATGDVTGTNRVGGLVGQSFAAGGYECPSCYDLISIINGYATGNVTGTDFVGGLVGSNNGGISTSYATGNVNGHDNVGGLAGWRYGPISDAYATGNVTGVNSVGGLVGYSTGDYFAISNSHAEGHVSGYDFVGGFIGFNWLAPISNDYALGNVNGHDEVGGLVGRHYGVGISNSYAVGNVSGNDAVGGLAGWAYSSGGLHGHNRYTPSGEITNVYATGSVSGHDYVGGLLGDFYRDPYYGVSNVYSAGSVSGHNHVGGLIGQFHRNGYTDNTSNAFWNIDTSGQTSSASGIGKTTAEMQQTNTFSAWDISNVGGSSAIWRIYEGHTLPLLRSFLSPFTLQNADDVAVSYDGNNKNGNSFANIDGVLGTAASGRNAGVYNGYYSTQQAYDLIGGNLIINPAPLTLSADNVTKTYDGTLTAITTAVIKSGTLFSGDSLIGGVFAYADKNVGNGNKIVTASGVTVGDGIHNANYAISYIDNLTSTITPATLTYTAHAVNRAYGIANPTFTGEVTGFVANETLASATTGMMTFTSPAISSSPVGNYAIDGSGLIANNGNYLFVQAKSNDKALSITPEYKLESQLSPLQNSTVFQQVIADYRNLKSYNNINEIDINTLVSIENGGINKPTELNDN